MPPLRRRNEDIIIIARHFAKIYANKYLKPTVDFDAGAIQKLKSYGYPGNVRELQYTIERAVIMADDHVLRADDLIFSIHKTPAGEIVVDDDDNVPLSALGKNAILRVIEKHDLVILRVPPRNLD